MIVIKFRGGPLANTYQAEESAGERFAVRKPKIERMNMFAPQPEDLFKVMVTHMTGHYAKSNVRTKSGAYVYEWLGWEGEVIAR